MKKNSFRKNMIKRLLLRHVSAVSIQHVVTAKGIGKRLFWMISVTFMGICMILMTRRVLQEYFKYPKALQTETVSVGQLEFPAITICGRYMVPRINVKDANLEYIEELWDVVESLPLKNTSLERIHRCGKDPLCRWNRFLEKCECLKSPCDTPLCLSLKNSSMCTCSGYPCIFNDTSMPGGCQFVVKESQKICICNRDFQYPRFDKTLDPEVYNESIIRGNYSQEVLNLIRTLKRSKTNDLADVEHRLIPSIRTLDNYGISYDSLILSCEFGREKCSIERDITTLYSPTYGTCYMFNYFSPEDLHNNGKPRISRHPGRNYGLHLYLQSERKNMLPLLSKQLGARITVHDPLSLPFSRDSGFEIPHNSISSISVHQIQISRLGEPWGKCAKDGDIETTSDLTIPYNQIACERNCSNNAVFNRCKCYHRYFLSGRATQGKSKLCGTDQEKCFLKVLRDINANKVQCRCPPPCKEIRYKVFMSSGKLNKEFLRVMKKARSLKLINGTPSVVKPTFRLDMMGVEVFYKSLTMTNVSETSIYSWQFLIANIGGNIGLFLGLSLITFVEVAEFLFEFFLKLIFKQK